MQSPGDSLALCTSPFRPPCPPPPPLSRLLSPPPLPPAPFPVSPSPPSLFALLRFKPKFCFDFNDQHQQKGREHSGHVQLSPPGICIRSVPPSPRLERWRHLREVGVEGRRRGRRRGLPAPRPARHRAPDAGSGAADLGHEARPGRGGRTVRHQRRRKMKTIQRKKDLCFDPLAYSSPVSLCVRALSLDL